MSVDLEKIEISSKPHIYEVSFVLDPALSEEKVQGFVAFVKTHIADTKGSFISEDSPKMKQLAYTMIKSTQGEKKRYSTGFFGWIKFELEASAVVDFKKALEKRDEVVRFLIIETVRESTLAYPKPSYMRTDPDKSGPKKEVPHVQEGVTPSPISEEELDKSIEKLIV